MHHAISTMSTTRVGFGADIRCALATTGRRPGGTPLRATQLLLGRTLSGVGLCLVPAAGRVEG